MNKNEIPEDPDNDPRPLILGAKFGLYAVAILGGLWLGNAMTEGLLQRPDLITEGCVVGVALCVYAANKLSKYLFPKSTE